MQEKFKEIDDRYPEFARPYEPVKGVKHKKKLSSAQAMIASVFAVLVMTIPAVASPPQIIVPEREPAPIEQVQPTPEVKVEEPPAPMPAKEPEAPKPSPKPVAPVSTTTPTVQTQPQTTQRQQQVTTTQPRTQTTTTPTTVTTDRQTEDADAPTTSVETPPPEVIVSPDPSPTEPETPVTPPPEDTPVTPPKPDPPTPPSPSAVEPTIEISHVYYWDCLSHVEVEYTVAANDATDISTTTTVQSNREPSMKLTMPTSSGGGTKDVNADSYGQLQYLSGDAWTTVATMTYTLNGEVKTKRATTTAQPEFMGFSWFSPMGTSSSGSNSEKSVYALMDFSYSASDRHQYNVRVTKVTLGWMKPVLDPSWGGYTLDPVGDTRVIWDGSGTSPVSGPYGPTQDGDSKYLRFEFNQTIDVTPSASASAAGATHFYLIFDIAGTGTDTDGTAYQLRYPTYGQSVPDSLSGDVSFTEPDISFETLTLWSGVDHVEVEYDIEPNDADVSSLSSSMSITNASDGGFIASGSGGSMYGTVDVNATAAAAYSTPNPGTWTVQITLDYNVMGSPHSKTVTVNTVPTVYNLEEEADYIVHQGPPEQATVNYEVYFMSSVDDRHTYYPTFTAAYIEWAAESGGTYVPVASRQIVWNGGDPNPYYGPYPYSNTYWNFIGYSFWHQTVNTVPPASASGATHFRLIFEAGGYGTDTDGTNYTFHGVKRELATEWLTIPT